MRFEMTLNPGVLFEGSIWLTAWQKIPLPPPKAYDMPPRGAAGEAVLTYAWQAELFLYWAVLQDKVLKGALSPVDFEKLRGILPEWKELGGDDALKLAAGLPPKYGRAAAAFMLYGRHQMRGIYDGARGAKATTTWVRPNGGASDESIASTANVLGVAPLAVAGWALPIVALGIVGTCAAAWYGSKVAEHGIAVEAERVSSMARAWRDVQIAQAQLAQGKDVNLPEFVSRGAQIEAVQHSPWMLGAVGVATGAVTVGALAFGMTGRRQNPSHVSRRTRRCVGRDVEVAKYASGFRAWLVSTTGKRGRSVDVKGAKTFADAFRLACADIRKHKRNPAAIANPKKKSSRHPVGVTKHYRGKPKKKKRKKKKTKKKTKKKRKTSKRKTTRKTSKRKTTKRKTTKRKTTKRKTTKRTKKRKTSKKKRSPAIKKSTFVRRQMAKKRSKKQAEADWKLRQSARKRAA